MKIKPSLKRDGGIEITIVLENAKEVCQFCDVVHSSPLLDAAGSTVPGGPYHEIFRAQIQCMYAMQNGNIPPEDH